MPQMVSAFNWRKALFVMAIFALSQYAYYKVLPLFPFPEAPLNRFLVFMIVFLPTYILAIVAARRFFRNEQAGLPSGVLLALVYFVVLFGIYFIEDFLRTLFNASYGVAVIDSTFGSWPVALIIVIYSMYSGWRRAL